MLFLGIRWLLGWFVGGRFPTLASVSAGASPPAPQARDVTLSVIIPARNEAATLSPLLASLSAQRRSPHQVIVVDDQSTDATADVAARGGATVIRPASPPEGWLGKPWACAQGAAVATGEVLVFVDADTTLGPECLEQLAPIVIASGGLLSVAPYHATRYWYESASALFNLVAIMGTGAASVVGRARITGAFGPCLVMRRDDYDAIGGHGAVRHEVLDDVALAQRCAAIGLPVRCLAGGSIVRFRMYPDGIGQLVEGWSKNFAAGAGRTPPVRLLVIVAWMSGLIEAGWWTVLGVAAAASGTASVPVAHVIAYVAFAAQLWVLLRPIGNFAAAAALHPLSTLAFLAICARSIVLSVCGRATWKGRTIALRSR